MNKEPTKCVAVLYIDDEPRELHYFPLPRCGQPGFYRAVTSYEATRNREAERNFKWMTRDPKSRLKKPRYRLSLWRVEENLHSLKFLDEHHPELLRRDHANLFALYAFVGYNYRKARWSRM